MWFDLATNKKMIHSIFPQGIALINSELCSINVTGKDVQLSLNCCDIPSSYPKKWMMKDFNAIRIVLELGDVLDVNYRGVELGWVDRVDFFGNGDDMSKSTYIKNEKFEFNCLYKYLTVKNIQPYDDVRWD
jgi:hypothetical protein